MKLGITLSANAGISVKTEYGIFWIDAIHKIQSTGYSTVSEKLFEELFTDNNFGTPDLLLFTHRHSDHYSPEYLYETFSRCPDAAALTPYKKGIMLSGNRRTIEKLSFCQQNASVKTKDQEAQTGEEDASIIRIPANDIEFEYNGVSIRFFRTFHMGNLYRSHAHYSILLSFPEKRNRRQVLQTESGTAKLKDILSGRELNAESTAKKDRHVLIAGDAALKDSGLWEFLEKESIRPDLSIMPFPWLTVKDGRDILKEHIKPEKLLLTHLPFEEDDTERYLASALRMKNKADFSEKVYMLFRPLESLELEI